MPPLTKILIIEDEAVLAENLQSYLARKTQDVRIAGDSHSAMKVLECFTPDIVILDFSLPGMDGLQTHAAIIRQLAPLASCIMISGHLTDDLSCIANGQGIQHVLCKPFSFAELQRTIDLSLVDTAEVTDILTQDDTVTLNDKVPATQLVHNTGYPLRRSGDRRVAVNRRGIDRRVDTNRRSDDRRISFDRRADSSHEQRTRQ